MSPCSLNSSNEIEQMSKSYGEMAVYLTDHFLQQTSAEHSPTFSIFVPPSPNPFFATDDLAAFKTSTSRATNPLMRRLLGLRKNQL